MVTPSVALLQVLNQQNAQSQRGQIAELLFALLSALAEAFSPFQSWQLNKQ
jgi:hypothetical protein